MSLKVGLDIQVLQSHERSGYGYYVEGLFQALQDQAPHDIKIIGLKSRWPTNLSTWPRWYHDRFELNQLATATGVDIIHQPCFSAPKSRQKVVWTLHDLRQTVLHEAMGLPATLYWEKWLPYSARYADQVVVTSNATKNDAIKYLGLASAKMKLITIGLPLGLHAWRPNPELMVCFKEKFKLTEPYFATLGSTQPIKNYPFLIDVFVVLRQAYNRKCQLVIIGSKSWGYGEIQAKLAEHKLIEGQDVVITGYVEDNYKWQLLAESDAFLFPSRYEGFGIPPIEAQAVGTPVLCADNSSLPWVVGDGAILCSATDVKTWLVGYDKLTQTRATLIKNGLENVKRFDWSKIAQEWLALYCSL